MVALQQTRAPATTCAAAPLGDAAMEALLDAQAAYYRGDWYGAFDDGPSFPGSGCTRDYATDGRKQHGALCFDAACAPPLVAGFACDALSKP
jgi:hypothetical protein